MSSEPSSPASPGRLSRRVAAFTIMVALAGCSLVSPQQPYRDDEVGGSVFQPADDIRQHVESGGAISIRLSYHDSDSPYAALIRQGMQQAAQEFGVDAQLIGPPDDTAATQVAELNQLIDQRSVHGLAVSSSDLDALKPVFARAYDEGIPLISFNTNNAGSRQQGFVGQDLVQSGEFLATSLVEALNGQAGKIITFTIDAETPWSDDRWTGFSGALEDLPNLQLEPVVATGRSAAQITQVVQQTMAIQGQGAVAIATLDPLTLRAVGNWVQQSGQADNIVVMGFDLLADNAELIQAGAIDGAVSSNPVDQGYTAVKVLVDFLREGTELPIVNTGNTLVTQENLATVPVEG